ncbi:MAG: ATP-binding cassette domain-containing protein [Bowdeniella nasicola]|nr:ATP-binding cassette domain-containing protein [Bowdeniella nasicola]
MERGKRGFQGAMLNVLGAVDYTATVLESRTIAPHLVRVRVHCPGLLSELDYEPTAWLRCWFPDPAGTDRQFQRAYTIVDPDISAEEFSLEFVLHEPAGPASIWARGAQPGDSIALTPFSSGRRFHPPAEEVPGYLLIGDSASLPAINSLIESLPPDPAVELVMEQHCPEDRDLPIAQHPHLSVTWVPRRGVASLAEALPATPSVGGTWYGWYVWATPESASLKLVRARLTELGFEKRFSHILAYWIEGRAMGTTREAKEVATQVKKASKAGQLTVAPEVDEACARDATIAPPASAEDEADASESSAPPSLFAPVRRAMIVTGVLQGLATLIQLAPYVILALAAGRLLDGADLTDLAPYAWAFAYAFGIGATLAAAVVFYAHLVDSRFSYQLRSDVLDKLTRLPLGWFVERGPARVRKTVVEDTGALHYLVTHAIPEGVSAVVAPIAVLLTLLWVSWPLTLMLLIPVLGAVFILYHMMIEASEQIREAQTWEERMGTYAEEFLTAQPIVRIFGGHSETSFGRHLREYVTFLHDWERPFTARKIAMNLIVRPQVLTWYLLVIGTVFGAAGFTSLGELLVFLTLGTAFGSQLLGIGYGFQSLRIGLNASANLAALLRGPELATHAPDNVGASSLGAGRVQEAGTPSGPPTPGGAHVQFNGVRFGYRVHLPVLENITVDLPPGTVTALVGASGSGKSTMASLLARFYDVDAGSITLDGTDLRDLTQEELYTRVGFVFQDTQLVGATVRENIALARPDASLEEVRAAARAAHIDDRIMELPLGYDTPLGVQAELSGGERQRVAIARMLLADPPVIVLDEATSAADPISEHLVYEGLTRLIEGRTVLVIAHRLSTITGADQIVVLDGGAVAERGTHEELVARSGRYAELWHTFVADGDSREVAPLARTEGDAR